MFRIILVGFVSFLLFSEVSICRLQIPDSLDFGEVPAGNLTSPNIKMLPLTIYNNEDFDYSISHIEIIYNLPDSIMTLDGLNGSGNVFSMNLVVRNQTEEYLIQSEDSLYIPVAFTTYFFDDISKNGGYLEISAIIYSKPYFSDMENIDTVHIRAKTIESEHLLTSSYNFRDIIICPSGLNNSIVFSDKNINIINNLETDVVIDSINYEIFGDNIKYNYRRPGIRTTTPFDSNIVESNSSIQLKFSVWFNKFEESKVIANVYCHLLGNKDSTIILKDSLVMNFIESKRVGKIAIKVRQFVAYKIGDQILDRSLFVLTCCDKYLNLDTMYFTGDIIDSEFKIKSSFEFNYPLKISPLFENELYIDWTASAEGERIGKLIAEFSDDKGEKYIQYFNVRTYVYSSTSVHDGNYDPEDEIYLYPNPASDFVNIDFNNLSTQNSIKIYDILGNLLFVNNSTEKSLSIDISKFSNGIYNIILENSTGIISKKLRINK